MKRERKTKNKKKSNERLENEKEKDKSQRSEGNFSLKKRHSRELSQCHFAVPFPKPVL